MVEVLFYVCIFLVIYSYAMYPLILIALSFFQNPKILTSDQNPLMTLVISAFNEEAVISRKLENALGLDYPKERLEVLVVSDNSTDKTDEIVMSYVDRGVILIAQPIRQGKTAGLNHAISKAKGEIVVFTDANSIFEPTALKRMTRLFGDPHIGLVTGSTRYVAKGEGRMVETNSVYTQLERFIKRLETGLGSCVGADGAIFAVRRSLYQPLADDDINDFVIPLQVVKQGYRVVFDKEVFCTEETAKDASGEFSRQTRITNRTLRAIFRYAELLNPFKFPLFGFQLISHKVIRFCTPFFLILLIPLNLMLLHKGTFYQILFAGQLLFYTAALLGFFQESIRQKHSRFSFFYHFLMVNISILLGWIKFLSGQRDVTWEPQRN